MIKYFMKKYFDKEGKEVTFGDLIKWEEEYKEEGYYRCSEYAATLTEDNVEKLKAFGAITEKNVEEPNNERNEALEDLKGAFAAIGVKLGMDYHDVVLYTKPIFDNYPWALKSMVLIELAKKYNKQYKKPLSKYKEVYGISFNTSEIFPIPVDKVVNWDSFAAFKHKEDAYRAVKAIDGEIVDEQSED